MWWKIRDKLKNKRRLVCLEKTKEEAKSCLVHSGKMIIRDEGLVVFEIDDFGGLEGADGIGSILCGGGDWIATGVMCIFKTGTEGDGEIDEKTLDKLAKAVEKGLDKAFDKKVDKEEMRQILLEESPNEEDKIDSLVDGDINCTWLGEKTYIEVLYYKGKSLTINYSDISDEHGQYLLSVDK